MKNKNKQTNKHVSIGWTVINILFLFKDASIIMCSLQVNLSFPSAQSLPASDTHLTVKATPLSLCALTAVDQSVLLLKPEAKLSPQSVSVHCSLEYLKMLTMTRPFLVTITTKDKILTVRSVMSSPNRH